MIHFNIFNSCSSDNLPELKELLEPYPGYALQEVKIEYNPSNGLPDQGKNWLWPFKAYFRSPIGTTLLVRIFSLTAGYHGSGPADLIQILRYLNVDFDESDILDTKCSQKILG